MWRLFQLTLTHNFDLERNWHFFSDLIHCERFGSVFLDPTEPKLQYSVNSVQSYTDNLHTQRVIDHSTLSLLPTEKNCQKIPNTSPACHKSILLPPVNLRPDRCLINEKFDPFFSHIASIFEQRIFYLLLLRSFCHNTR